MNERIESERIHSEDGIEIVVRVHVAARPPADFDQDVLAVGVPGGYAHHPA
jgi:hypothetical protein